MKSRSAYIPLPLSPKSLGTLRWYRTPEIQLVIPANWCSVPFCLVDEQPQTSYFPTAFPQQPDNMPNMIFGDGTMGLGGNRNSRGMPLKPSGYRDWSFRLCDGFGATVTCLLTWCCPALIYGNNHARLEHLNSAGTVIPGGSSMVRSCTAHGHRLWLIQN